MAKRKLKKNIGKRIISGLFYTCGILFVSVGIVMAFSLDNGVLKSVPRVSNNNLNKSISSKELVNTFQELDKSLLEPVMYNNFVDAINNAKYYPTSFVGKLVHYGPDCPECGGHLGCNGQDARNGNIYYNDKEYGKVRIVAMSASVPCGSMIRINVDAYDKNGMYAIVLDRGVSGPMVDLLKKTSRSKSVGTRNGVVFDIVRYGY